MFASPECREGIPTPAAAAPRARRAARSRRRQGSPPRPRIRAYSTFITCFTLHVQLHVHVLVHGNRDTPILGCGSGHRTAPRISHAHVASAISNLRHRRQQKRLQTPMSAAASPSEAQRTAAAPPPLFSSTSLPLWTRQAARPYHPACHRDCRSSAPISPKAGLAACLLSDLPEAGLAACGRSWRDDGVGRVLGALEASREDLARAPVLWVRGERRSSGGAR